MKKWLIVLFITVSSYEWFIGREEGNSLFDIKVDNNRLEKIENNTQTRQQIDTSINLLEEAYKNEQSGVQVHGSGTVVKLLKDDLKGSKHQKFILRLSPERTILVVHNIDLAPRINAIANGDKIQFSGEYEWSKQGGLVHWTHLDPRGNHADGWLKHEGKIYQ
ncbi:DUF3465 domain-containing protein [Psychromonas aquatilis]|uniref:DUF3465 domain-containing protein n=1 Tax=Psychromonas aquatilis TaxID=2005072 RepID=A0ABU9GTH4_9GAMM